MWRAFLTLQQIGEYQETMGTCYIFSEGGNSRACECISSFSFNLVKTLITDLGFLCLSIWFLCLGILILIINEFTYIFIFQKLDFSHWSRFMCLLFLWDFKSKFSIGNLTSHGFVDGAPTVTCSETKPSETNVLKDKQFLDSKQAPSKQVKPIASLHKILKFKLVSEDQNEMAEGVTTSFSWFSCFRYRYAHSVIPLWQTIVWLSFLEHVPLVCFWEALDMLNGTGRNLMLLWRSSDWIEALPLMYSSSWICFQGQRFMLTLDTV